MCIYVRRFHSYTMTTAFLLWVLSVCIYIHISLIVMRTAERIFLRNVGIKRGKLALFCLWFFYVFIIQGNYLCNWNVFVSLRGVLKMRIRNEKKFIRKKLLEAFISERTILQLRNEFTALFYTRGYWLWFWQLCWHNMEYTIRMPSYALNNANFDYRPFFTLKRKNFLYNSLKFYWLLYAVT